MYFNANFNLFFFNKKAHLLVSEIYTVNHYSTRDVDENCRGLIQCKIPNLSGMHHETSRKTSARIRGFRANFEWGHPDMKPAY